jgi:osmoprotectant transport system permease protein
VTFRLGGERRPSHRARRATRALATIAALVLGGSAALAGPKVTIGSKAFAESWVLGEALVALARDRGAFEVDHRKNLGGTEVVYQALLAGDIDAYVEYTGTIEQTILKAKSGAPFAAMKRELEAQGVGLSDPLGFDDSYALAASPSAVTREGLTTISDLRAHPDLRLGFTHEFLGRRDGFDGLSDRYELRMSNVRGFQHELALEALGREQLDVTDVYTTDPEIEKLRLVVLKDDRRFFPQYQAVILYRLALAEKAPAALDAMLRLVGKVDEKTMTHANAMVSLDRQSTEAGARYVLAQAQQDAGEHAAPTRTGLGALLAQVGHDVLRHVELVSASLLAAVIVGVPFGIWASRARAVAAVTLIGAGVVQTIPSLALLAFLIPLLGIGVKPALVALFVYSLLPIVRGTFTGLTSVPSSLSEAADAIGLPSSAKLARVTLPMASPAIMAGIRTSAVINVGTATLAALIGAEGLGNPIMQGIALRDTRLILRGAVPAALLALAAEALFYGLEKLVVPRGLRISSGAR